MVLERRSRRPPRIWWWMNWPPRAFRSIRQSKSAATRGKKVQSLDLATFSLVYPPPADRGVLSCPWTTDDLFEGVSLTEGECSLKVNGGLQQAKVLCWDYPDKSQPDGGFATWKQRDGSSWLFWRCVSTGMAWKSSDNAERLHACTYLGLQHLKYNCIEYTKEESEASQHPCNFNKKCEESRRENTFNCRSDCPTGSKDGICDQVQDGRCDPDCTGEKPDLQDPDCETK